MNELVNSPFGPRSGQLAESAGSRTQQARENTEVMALAMMAKRFPRDLIASCDRIRNAFTRVTLAEKAQYAFSKGGSEITGPSIHAAQAMAQQWHNLSSGWREVTRTLGPDGVGVSEVEAYCVDYESTNREAITFFVRHWRDTKRGGYALKDEREIYELCANQAQRRKRACILAQIPGDVTEMAMDQASVTLKATADTGPEAMKKMVDAFAPFHVTTAMIEKRIQRRLDSIQPAQVIALKRIYVSLRDEMSTPADWFDVEPDAHVATGIDAVKAASAKVAKTDKPSAPRGSRKPIDQDTGETDPPPPPPASGNDAPPTTASRSYASFVEAINTATSPETAALELDGARSVLPPADYEALIAVYKQCWSE